MSKSVLIKTHSSFAEWTSVSDLVNIFGVTRQAIHKRIREKSLDTVRIKNKVYLSNEDIDQWAKERD